MKDIEGLIRRLENALNIIESLPELKEMIVKSINNSNDNNRVKIKEPNKQVLTADEAADYLGITRSYLYKMTMRKEIPYYKPNGKNLYFDLDELNSWIKKCRVSSQFEIEERARTYFTNKKKY